MEKLQNIDPATLTPDQRYTYNRLMKALSKGRYKFELLRQLLRLNGGALPVLPALITAGIEWAAANAFLASFFGSITALVSEKAATDVSRYVYNSGKNLLRWLQWWRKNRKALELTGVPANIAREGEQLTPQIINERLENLGYLGKCPADLSYLYQLLKDKNIDSQMRDTEIIKIIKKYYDLDVDMIVGNPSAAYNRRRAFLFCIIGILTSLALSNFTSYHSLLQKLLEALNNGRFSKSLIRYIIRRLKKAGIPIPSEFEEYDYAS